MAQLKDSTVAGSINVTDTLLASAMQTGIVKAPTTSGGTTYGTGSNGQVLKSNGTTVYWADDNDHTNFVANNQGTGNSGKFLTVNSSGQVVCSNFSDMVTPRTSADLSANGATVTAPAGYYASAATKTVASATPAFDGGTLSGGSTATSSQLTMDTTSTSAGVQLQTAYTASSTAVLYNGAVNGWVSVADNTQALAAKNKTSTSGTKYYVTKVTVPKDKQFTAETTADTALDTSSDLDVTNNAYRRVDITNKANGTVLVANSGNSTITSGSATAGNLSVNAYNGTTASGEKSIVSAGKWVETSTSTPGTYYGKVVLPTGTCLPSGNIQLTTSSSTDVSAYATATAKTATPTFSGGTVDGTATASGNGANLSSTNNSGITITAACTVRRLPVVYSAAVDGWVTKAKNAQAYAASSSTALPGTTYYLNGVTLPKSKSFSITVYTGASTQMTFVFTTDANGNTTVTEES